MYQNSGM